jgi:uncharacterized protein (DUF885 family)
VTVERLLLVLALPWIACSHSAKPSSLAESSRAESFASFVDDYFDAEFAFNPTRATHEGFHQYDLRLEDRSRPRIEARISELKGFLSRLKSLNRSALGFDESIDAQVLEARIHGALLDLETLRWFEQNPMAYARIPGASVDSLVKRTFAPGRERLRAVVVRMRSVPQIYAAARANLRNPPKEFTDLAIRIAKGSVGFFEKSLSDWARAVAGDDRALANDFQAVNAEVVAATRDFAGWLERELASRSTGSYAIGEENFLAKLKYEEMVALPLPQLLAKGEAQLAKDYAAFVETARQINPAQTAQQVMSSLSDQHPSASDLIPTVARSLEEARRFVVEKQLVTVPSEVRPHVEETPPYARSGGFASMDTPGAYETRATEAFYYVTPVENDWSAQHKEEHLRLFNPYVVAMINVHEAYPGHYLQFLYAPIFPTKTRKLVSSASNAEGWAHYAEQMMVDRGLGGGDPKIRLAQLQEALLRDCRYVVGIKLHTQGLTVDQGARIFVEKALQEPANAYEEARRGTYNPTYIYYTLGKLEIQALRDEFRARRGGTLRSFHDAFISQGALPIPLLRKILFR